MSLVDVGWLWNLLNQVAQVITDFFGTVWDAIQGITNIGQGIFGGLVSFGSQLWDAIIRAFNTLGTWLGTAFNWIYQGLQSAANVFGQFVNMAFSWIGSALSFVGTQIYNLGNWLFNTLAYVGQFFSNIISWVWGAIMGFFGQIVSTVGSWITTVITTVNNWFKALLLGFRNKIIQTIRADIAIAGAWKSGERLLLPQSTKDLALGVLGLFASPLVGHAVAIVADALIPTPASSTFELIPPFSMFEYTPEPSYPTTPSAPTPPSMGAPLSPSGWFTGVQENNLPIALTLSIDWVTPAQKSASVGLAYGIDADATSLDAPINLSYETEIA